MEPRMSAFTNSDWTTQWPITDTTSVAYYVRRSTFEQENEHQLASIRSFLDDHDIPLTDAQDYVETASGAKRDRDELRALMGAIEDGNVDHVVVWELSRIARDGLLAQEFYTLCEEEDVVIHITDGNVKVITPDGQNRLVADIYASIYADERRTLVRRTKLGQERALENDKWIGKPPLGFTTDSDGYLIANVELYEEYNDDRDGFYAVAEAMRRLEEDEEASYRGLAKDMECSRRALSDVYNDAGKRDWYLRQESDDERVQRALNELAEMEADA